MELYPLILEPVTALQIFASCVHSSVSSLDPLTNDGPSQRIIKQLESGPPATSYVTKIQVDLLNDIQRNHLSESNESKESSCG